MKAKVTCGTNKRHADTILRGPGKKFERKKFEPPKKSNFFPLNIFGFICVYRGETDFADHSF